MGVQPGKHDIRLRRRADFSLDLQFKDSSNTVINLTGATIYAQVWNEARTTKTADFAVAYTNRTNGQVSLTLTDVQTTTFATENDYETQLRYDVMLEDSTGKREYYLEGIIYVLQGYTAP